MTDFNYTWRRSGATPAVITGNQVARRHLTKCERARLAGSIMDGTTRVEKLNQRQAAAICGISIAYARRMRRPQSDVPQLQAAE